MMELDTLGARIEYLQRKVGGSGNLKNLSGIPQPQQSRIIRGVVENPGVHTISAMAKAAGVSLQWVITGEGSPEDSGQSAGGYVALPFIEPNGQAPVMFERQYLTNVLGVKIADAAMFKQSGDAMSPTVKNGDHILVDTSKKTGNGVFLIRIDDQLYLQRLQHLPGAGVDIISDNDSYKSYTLKPEQVEVVGQLAWVGSR